MQKSPGGMFFFSPLAVGTRVCRLACITQARTPWKEVPTCEENAERNLHAATPPPSLPLPRLGGGNVCAGFAGCVPSQMFPAESERCSVLWGESPQPCSPSCRDVLVFFCLCLTRKCRSVIVLIDCSLFFSSLVFRSSRVATDPNQMEAGQTAAAKTRPSSRCVRAAPTLVFPRLSRSPF